MTAAKMPDSIPVEQYRRRLDDGCIERCRRYDAGEPVAELVAARSRLTDTVLGELWQSLFGDSAAAALIAVGGYGRAELHPHSDIDILILTEVTSNLLVLERIERLIGLLWDIGLAVGHAVRTVADCVDEARRDTTVITNLIEARLVAGSAALFEAMRAATAPERIWDSVSYFEAKSAEQRVRWTKYGDTAYNLEPNIKENPGGLRDIQIIGWVTRRHFGATNLHDLVVHGFLTESEYRALIAGQTLLWRIRFALHRLAGRCEDRLLFDHQRTLAIAFGFSDGPNNLAVEQFMQQYYRTVQELNRLNEMLLQLFREAILLNDDIGPPVPLNRRFQSRSGYLEVTSSEVFRRSPTALLEVFHLLQTRRELQGVRATTIRLIREHLHLIDDDFRASLAARSLFMEVFRAPEGLTHAIRRMNRWGVLAAYIPAFANIVGRMQYDLLHVYTVDEHTLTVVRNLRRFFIARHEDEFPLCNAVARGVHKPHLLYLAGLFHDIAKGRGGDHSLLGARDAYEFCARHALGEYDTNLVAWLVEQHLLMSITAQRKDISDPAVIQAFAALVGDTTRLDYLYLLTVADARATNPGRWNGWVDALLRELYLGACQALARGLDNPQAQGELVAQKQEESLRLIARHGGDVNASRALWRGFTQEFFLHHSPDDIAWQSRQMLAVPANDEPVIALRPLTARGSTEILIYIRDRDNLFARTTAALDRLGLSILDARLMTASDGMTVNNYQVLDQDGTPVDDSQRIDEIRHVLAVELGPEYADERIHVARRPSHQHRHFPVETQLAFGGVTAQGRTLMRLTAVDRPGLLARVGAVFKHCGIRLHSAKIATVGAAVDDVFFITCQRDGTRLDDAALDCLSRELRERIDQETNP